MVTSYARRGLALEEVLEYQHLLYRSAGVADIRKLPTDWHVTGRRENGLNHGWVAFPARKSVVDYLGFLMDGSCRHIAVEAKQTAGERWPLSALPEHQQAYLAAVDRWGGVAGVVLWWTTRDVLWALPWSLVRAEVSSGRKSIAFKDGCGVPVQGTDYLPALRFPHQRGSKVGDV
jgi:penicillin-binding protein-related factor A (putative recombinase)